MTHAYRTLIILLIFIFATGLNAIAQETNDEYRKTIEMADSYFTKGDYINAKASYQIAVRLAPNEQYPKDRLQQSLDMIKVQMYQNSLYTQKIQVADDYFRNQDMENALRYYQEALTILPGDVYASGKIQEINRNRADSQQVEENYQKSIAGGDKFLKEGKLEQALAEFKNALSLKPAESYPKEKSLQIESQIAEKKQISDEFQAAMRDAELAVSRNKYDEAISLLEKAINLVPADPLPKQKLAEAQNLKAAWESYSSIISAADELYVNKDFLLAKDKYLQAQSIKPDDEYPRRMLEKIDIALMDVEQANRSSYEFAIEKADALFSQQDYEKAMVEYNNALRFKPDADYAKQRINDINAALSLRKSQEEAYSQAITKADLLYQEEKYSEARDEYNRAISIKPLEQYPKIKVEELNTKLADLATKRELYNNLIKGADRLYFSDEYVEAREQYREASYLFPKEKYPQDQITMINEILGVRDKYVKAVTRADRFLFEKDLDSALIEFRTAAALSPKEAYPAEKIKELEAIQARYVNLVTEGDKAFTAAQYQQALSAYQQAASLKPQAAYPSDKITEINNTLVEIAAKEAAAEEAARIAAEQEAARIAAEQEAARIAAEQEAARIAAEQEAARLAAEKAAAEEAARIAAEQEAARIAAEQEAARLAAEAAAKKAAEEEAARIAAEQEAARIAAEQEAARVAAEKAAAEEAARIAAEQEAARLAAEEAAKKAAEEEAARIAAEQEAARIAAEQEAARIAAEQEAARLAAEKAAAEEAAKIAAEQEAARLAAEAAAKKAAEEEAARIAAEQEVARIAAEQEAARLAAEKAAAEEAARIAAEQDAARIAAEQEAARLAAEKAAAEEAARIAAEQEAARLAAEAAAKKAAEEEAARIAAEKEAARIAAEQEAARIAAEQEAARLAAEKAAAEEAARLAAEAAAKKAAEEEAARIAAEQEAARLAAEKAAAEEAARIAAEQEAARIAAEQEAARLAAEAAAKKAAEEEAARIAAEQEAARLAAEKAAAEAAAKKAAEEEAARLAAEAALNKQYNDAVAQGNSYFDQAKYEEARSAYLEAASLKPAEELPGKQVIEIDRRLKEQEASREQAYQAAITKADNYLGIQDYEMAKLQYVRALELKPGEAYPTQKLEEVNMEIAKKRQFIQAEYDKVIKEADQAFAEKTYDNALESYRAASLLKPEEAYPQEMAGRILKLFTERSILQINKDPLLIANNTQHKFNFTPVPAKDRKSNYIFFKARNVSKHEYKLIISFGKDQAKNGGVVIKVPAGEQPYDYIVRISAQYKWFSDDNNWISFYPEGGDIEVYLMQVSYSD